MLALEIKRFVCFVASFVFEKSVFFWCLDEANPSIWHWKSRAFFVFGSILSYGGGGTLCGVHLQWVGKL